MGWDKDREITHKVLTQAKQTRPREMHLIYCKLKIVDNIEKWKQNLKHLLPACFSARLKCIPNSSKSSPWVAQTGR